MPLKIVTILGARPQFIKASAVSRLIKNDPGMQEILVHTGQHYDSNMSDVFFSELELPQPHYALGIGSDSHGKQTGKMLVAIEEVLLEEKPDWLLIYGDTNSTLAGALAAAKLHIPVAHVEAGLRSFNRRMPEEINRVTADHLSHLLFAPTETAVKNLTKEGVLKERIHLVGDVMYDAAIYYGNKADKASHILTDLKLTPKNYLLATMHRAENTDSQERMTTIVESLKAISEQLPVVFPIHPRTKKMLTHYGLDHIIRSSQNIKIIEPLGFLDMIMLEKNAALIVTDSGGVQKEAFFYHVPCVTLRDETEWVELVELGWNQVVPPVNKTDIFISISKGLESAGNHNAKPYGNGNSSNHILKLLKSFLH